MPTSLALDSNWIVVGLSSGRIHIFHTHTGVLHRTLVGHTSGVWAVALIKGADSRNSTEEHLRSLTVDDGLGKAPREEEEEGNVLSAALRRALGLDKDAPISDDRGDTSPQADARYVNKPSDPAGASDGWGQPNALVVTGGCDRDFRVWDVKSGYAFGHSIRAVRSSNQKLIQSDSAYTFSKAMFPQFGASRSYTGGPWQSLVLATALFAYGTYNAGCSCIRSKGTSSLCAASTYVDPALSAVATTAHVVFGTLRQASVCMSSGAISIWCIASRLMAYVSRRAESTRLYAFGIRKLGKSWMVVYFHRQLN